MDKETAYKILKDRIMLLSRGIVVPPRKWWVPVRHLQSFRGGPGPQGRVYFVSYNELEVPSKMVSLPIYPANHYLAKYAIPTSRSRKNPHDLITEIGVTLKGRVPFRAAKSDVFRDGTSIFASCLINIHCYNTFSTNIQWSCRHFETGEKCKFCTIDVATKRYSLPKRQSDENIVEAIEYAYKQKKVRSVTITSGTNPS